MHFALLFLNQNWIFFCSSFGNFFLQLFSMFYQKQNVNELIKSFSHDLGKSREQLWFVFYFKRKVMILTCMEVCWEYLCRLQQPSVKDDYSFETSPLIWEPNINLIFSYFNINILYHFISSPSMCKFWAKYLLIYLKFQTRIIWQIHTLHFEN